MTLNLNQCYSRNGKSEMYSCDNSTDTPTASPVIAPVEQRVMISKWTVPECPAGNTENGTTRIVNEGCMNDGGAMVNYSCEDVKICRFDILGHHEVA